MAQRLSLNLLRFYAHGQLRGFETPASCANGRNIVLEKYKSFSINGHTICQH